MIKVEMELDRISNLPNDVTEKILSLLPLKEVVRTNIWSRNWRNKSDMLHSLVFDDKCVSTLCSFVNIVDHVLLLRTSPIHKFKLSRYDELAARDIDRWVFHLFRNHVLKKMTLYIRKGNLYNIPSCVFSCQDIASLDLYRCTLNPPSTFKGFGSLKSLDLCEVNLAQDAFEKLIGCSPLLEKLKLDDCSGITSLKIDAQKLNLIEIKGGKFHDFNLVASSNLEDAIFDLQVDVYKRPAGRSGNLIKFLHRHPNLFLLTIYRNFLKYLSIGISLPGKFPNPCQYLLFLSVGIRFDEPDEISTLLCLLRSSPVLQELKIYVDPGKYQAAGGEEKSCLVDNYNFALTRLRLVKITKISYREAELDFIKCLLLRSPALERMTVQPSSAKGFLRLVKDLLMFKRASKSAEIMLLDP